MLHILRSARRRWGDSTGFRLAAWSVAVLAVVVLASVSYQAAIVIGAVLVGIALNYHLAIYAVFRLVRRNARRQHR